MRQAEAAGSDHRQFFLGTSILTLICLSFFSVKAEDAYRYYTWTVTNGTIYPLGVPQQVGFSISSHHAYIDVGRAPFVASMLICLSFSVFACIHAHLLHNFVGNSYQWTVPGPYN